MITEIIILVIGLLIGIILTRIIVTAKLRLEFKEAEKDIRQKSLSSSRRSLIGKFIERFVPFLEKFNYSPSDAHFLGQPVDYIIFDGLNEDNVKKVVFMEVKSGNSTLTQREKSLKRAIQNKQVFWEEMNVDTTNSHEIDKDLEPKEKTSFWDRF